MGCGHHQFHPAAAGPSLVSETIMKWRSSMRFRLTLVAVSLATLVAGMSGFAQNTRSTGQIPNDPPGTFSILGFDPATGEMGAAVQSRVFSVGNGVIWGEAGVGVAATQAVVDVSYGPKALAALRQGMSAEQALKSVMAADPDPRPQDWSKLGRQFAVLDTAGRVFAYTGPQAPDSAADKQCKRPNICTAQGNTLASKAVADS